MKKSSGLIESQLIKATMVLRALTNRTRQLIMLEITCNDNRRTVTEIITGINLPQAVVSQHLAILRHARVVTTHREGKNIYYSVDQNTVEKINTACRQIS